MWLLEASSSTFALSLVSVWKRFDFLSSWSFCRSLSLLLFSWAQACLGSWDCEKEQFSYCCIDYSLVSTWCLFHWCSWCPRWIGSWEHWAVLLLCWFPAIDWCSWKLCVGQWDTRCPIHCWCTSKSIERDCAFILFGTVRLWRLRFFWTLWQFLPKMHVWCDWVTGC